MDTDQVKMECIVPSVHSYADKDLPPPSKYYSSFFMITQCFEGKSNVVLDKKCQNPTYKDAGPVTSLTSGHTYWNEHCAACNNDTEKLLSGIPLPNWTIV